MLLFNYLGHALSEGNRGGSTYDDAESKDVDAAVHFLHETKGIRRVGVVGYSVGAVSAILSAARNPRIGAVVAVAPFNCVAEVWHTSRPALVPPFVLDLALALQRDFAPETRFLALATQSASVAEPICQPEQPQGRRKRVSFRPLCQNNVVVLGLVEKRKGLNSNDVCLLKVVRRIAPRPLLVIHGRDDQRIMEEQV